MKIRYELDTAWQNYDSYLEDLATRPEVKKICEIGGGANPSLPLDFIQRHRLEYTILDFSAEELGKAPDEYRKIQADIMSPNLSLDQGYDLIFSKMLAEHVQSGHDFHVNVLRLLREGGYAFHFFPTLYALPFVINFLIPDQLTEHILLFLQPSRTKTGKHSKFKAYYSWCRGPLKRQIMRFERLGYSVEEYVGFYGHSGYYKKIKPLHALHLIKSSLLTKYPIPLLTSYAYVLLRKKPGRVNSG
jgi:uncharacterized UPF0146 family protein